MTLHNEKYVINNYIICFSKYVENYIDLRLYWYNKKYLNII